MNEPKKSMVVRCNSCLAILTEPGALLFTPPDAIGQCLKIHWCVRCYRKYTQLGDDEEIMASGSGETT